MPWEKGRSGNPKGRPKKHNSYADMLEKAVKTLQSVQKDKTGNVVAEYKGKMVLAMAVIDLATNKNYPPQVRLQAVKEIFDRTDGKAPQYLDMQSLIELNNRIIADKNNIAEQEKLENLSAAELEELESLMEKMNKKEN